MDTIESTSKNGATEMVATVAAAFFQNNSVAVQDIGIVIESVRSGLIGGAAPTAATPMTPTTQEPKVPIKSSVKPDYIVCLEDGKKLKMLKRHLMSSFGLTPDQYRQKWGLPADYPMVAPNYAAQRRDLAVASGLGRVKGETAKAEAPAADAKTDTKADAKVEAKAVNAPKAATAAKAKTAEAKVDAGEPVKRGRGRPPKAK